MSLTIMTWIFGALALLLAYFAHKKSRELEKKLEEMTREYYGLSGRISDLARNLRLELPKIQIGLKRSLGKLKFEPNMTVGIALQVHPEAAQVLGVAGGGGCGSHSGINEWQTLEEIAAQQGKEVAQILGQLNGLLDGTTKLLPQTAAGFVPLANIKRRAPGERYSQIQALPK